jgi:hypothetical protein
LFERSAVKLEEASIQEHCRRFSGRRVEHELGSIFADGGCSAIDQTPARSVNSQIYDRASCGAGPHAL